MAADVSAGAAAALGSQANAETADRAVWTPVFVGLGANLGDRQSTLRDAVLALGALPGTRVVQASPLYRSAPVDAGGPDYLNAVAELLTQLEPHALLQSLQAIELAAGRERPYRNAPRTLDLDILWFGDEMIHTDELVVPHPRMAERAFVLRPLADVAPARVTASALQAVVGQAIELFESADWALDART